MTKASGRGKRGKVASKKKTKLFGTTKKLPKDKRKGRGTPGEITIRSWFGNS